MELGVVRESPWILNSVLSMLLMKLYQRPPLQEVWPFKTKKTESKLCTLWEFSKIWPFRIKRLKNGWFYDFRLSLQQKLLNPILNFQGPFILPLKQVRLKIVFWLQATFFVSRDSKVAFFLELMKERKTIRNEW